MWRCSYCRKAFDDHVDCINHARAQHSRDYTTCTCLLPSPPSGLAQAITAARRLISRAIGRLFSHPNI